MKNVIKKVTALSLVVGLCISSSLLVNRKTNKVSELYAGIGYLAAKNGASAEAGLAISVIGVADATLQGAAWGMAFGNVAGAVAGATVGTLSKILCKWEQDSAVSLFLYLDSVFKNKHKLIHNQAPVMNRLCPFLLNLHK